MDQLKVFGKFMPLEIIKHIFISYGEIDKIDLKENAIKIMGP